MKVSEKGKSLIKNFEGLRTKAYRCSANCLTIGYGHTGSDVYENMIITKEQAEKLFDQDILIHSNNVSKLVNVDLTQNQFDALVSFEYNVGYGNFSKSTMLKLINSCEFLQASKEFDKWIYAGGKPLKGLKHRREQERKLFES